MKNSRSNSKPIAPARRLDSVKEYYFSKKLKEIAQLNANGADIISLGIGGPDRPPHRDVIDTLSAPRLQYQATTVTSLTSESRNSGRHLRHGICVSTVCRSMPIPKFSRS